MPQMFPMSWLYLYMMLILTTLFYNTYTYFLFIKIKMNTFLLMMLFSKKHFNCIMTNLFSIFDPSYSFMFKLNWLVMFLYLLMMPYQYWIILNRFNNFF